MSTIEEPGTETIVPELAITDHQTSYDQQRLDDLVTEAQRRWEAEKGGKGPLSTELQNLLATICILGSIEVLRGNLQGAIDRMEMPAGVQ